MSPTFSRWGSAKLPSSTGLVNSAGRAAAAGGTGPPPRRRPPGRSRGGQRQSQRQQQAGDPVAAHPYPLRPLRETPSMMNRWAKMNRISTGTLAITPPTMMVA